MTVVTAVMAHRAPRVLAALVLALAVGCAARGAGAGAESGDQERAGPRASGPAFSKAVVVIGDDTIQVEVARTGAERAQGLMNRTVVPAGTGMIFVFEDVSVRSFWMQNTPVSLDIAFLDEELVIVDIQQMEAQSENFHESRAPAMYALEVAKGWLAEHGISVGDRAQLLPGP